MRARIFLMAVVVSCGDAKAPLATSTSTATSTATATPTPTATPTSTSTSIAIATSTSTAPAASPPDAGCASIASVNARLDVKKKTGSKTFGPRVTVAAATIVGPSGEKHELFAVPEPFHCTFGAPLRGEDGGTDPYAKTVSCTGDDGYGSARVTSTPGNLRVEWRDYGRGPGEPVTFDLALGTCERARIAVPSSLPSSH